MRLGGGTIGADTAALGAWHRAFYHTLARGRDQGSFVGKVSVRELEKNYETRVYVNIAFNRNFKLDKLYLVGYR